MWRLLPDGSYAAISLMLEKSSSPRVWTEATASKYGTRCLKSQ